MHHHHIDDPKLDSHQPQLFSGLDFELPLCFKQVPGGLVFITAFEEGPANPSWALKRA